MTYRVMSAVLVLIFLTSSFPKALGHTIVLGVLEDHGGHYAGDPNFWAVRAVFEKEGDEWEPFTNDCRDRTCLKNSTSSYPGEVTWTITFDGKNLGQVTSRTPKDFMRYSGVGQQEITSKEPVPTVGDRSSKFGGFTDASVYRPLVANSQPYFKDPESWKPSQLSNDVTRILRKHFREKFPTVSNCTNPDENVAKPWPYLDEDIKIVKAYSSKTAWSVARVQLEEYRCDGPSDDAFVDQWFVISPRLEVTFLDAGMWLVDAGDYDNDGRSELVFSIDRYNRGGYELFYGDFEKRVTFVFHYH